MTTKQHVASYIIRKPHHYSASISSQCSTYKSSKMETSIAKFANTTASL